MALHWYDISASAFMTYVELWHTTFNLPIWITEYAYQVIIQPKSGFLFYSEPSQDFNGNDQGDLPTIQSFMGEVNAWMDQQDYVEQYCWFGKSMVCLVLAVFSQALFQVLCLTCRASTRSIR